MRVTLIWPAISFSHDAVELSEHWCLLGGLCLVFSNHDYYTVKPHYPSGRIDIGSSILIFCHFPFPDVDPAGRDRCAMNAWFIQDAGTAIAMAAHGNVSAIRIGVAFYAIKVSTDSD